jgi:hypothetical protein
MFDKKFLVATLERAIKTFIQSFLALAGTDAAGWISVDQTASIKVSASAALLSILTSLGSSSFGKTGPSLAGESTETELVVVAPTATKTAKKAAPKKK